MMALDCPVCPRTQIAEASCPQCGTDLKPLLRLAELRAESQKPPEKPVEAHPRVEPGPVPDRPLWPFMAAFLAGLVAVPGWQQFHPPPERIVYREAPPPPAPAPPMKDHTVRNGESFWSIAKEKYGMGEMWKTIRDDNKDRLRRPGRLRAGDVIRLRTVTISPK
jgi:nucleoid-associated protein YgaU